MYTGVKKMYLFHFVSLSMYPLSVKFKSYFYVSVVFTGVFTLRCSRQRIIPSKSCIRLMLSTTVQLLLCLLLMMFFGCWCWFGPLIVCLFCSL